MKRVLKPEGVSFLEMTKPMRKTHIINKKANDEIFNHNNISTGTTAGIETMPQYNHTKKSLKELIQKTKIKKSKIEIKDFGGRDRLLLTFWKTG